MLLSYQSATQEAALIVQLRHGSLGRLGIKKIVSVPSVDSVALNCVCPEMALSESRKLAYRPDLGVMLKK
ncbi:MAG: hypothetical protein C0613_03905 [Desulfobulbaceae bacterium]|nr:MAG: hypothetical protein C0613_03905 [Desulfobulbaceae bacterium]